LKLLDIGV